MTTKYDPKARYEIEVRELELRRTPRGRPLMARIYQPKGSGPFPVLLDLHGGAWNNKDRTANEPMARAVAASGVLVVSPDMTLAPEAPYPACVQDAHYAVRWLKWKAPTWNGDPSTLGILGSSSGGHVGQLIAMKQREPMIKNNKTFWVPWETINEGNPQHVLDRKEHGPLPPLLIMQGGLDDNV